MVGALTNFFGLAGTAVNSVIGMITTATDFLLPDPESSQEGTLELPLGLKSDLHSLEKQIETDRKEELICLHKLVESLYEDATKYPELLNKTAGNVKSIEDRLKLVTILENNTREDYKKYFDTVKELENELKEELESTESEIKDQDASNDETAENARRVVSKFKQALQIGLLGFDIYKKYENDQAKLDALSIAIEEAEDLFQNLREFKESVYTFTSPTLKDMTNNLNYVASNLHTKSKVALDVQRWNARDALRDMKLQMQKLTKGFGKDHSLALYFKKLDDVITTLINIYSYIQTFQEQQTLANYIADVSSVAASRIAVTDPKLLEVVNELEMKVRSNLILKQYRTAFKAFKQFVFPFAHFYLDELILPNELLLENNIEGLVPQAVTQIENIKSKLDNYKLSVKKHDRYIGKGVFSSQYASTKPYFVWKNAENKNMLSELLSGREVVVKPDVMNSPPDMDAIKFNVIALDFRTKNETMQAKLYDLLKTFEIHAIHFGNSFYRYGDKTYLITTKGLALDFNFERRPDGEPVHASVVYEKMKNGDFMLSPYATWQLKMTNLTRNISFTDLGMYKDEIDLELTGYGHYVKKRGVSVLNLTLDKHYKTFYSYYELDPNADAELNTIDTDFSEFSTVLKHRVVRSMNQVEETSDVELDTDFSEYSTVLKYRDIRSFDQVKEMDRPITNGASPGLSSPINWGFNLLMASCDLITSKLVMFANQLFIVAEDENYNSNNHEKSKEIIQKEEEFLTSTLTTIEKMFHQEENEVKIVQDSGKESLEIPEADFQVQMKSRASTGVTNEHKIGASFVESLDKSKIFKPLLTNDQNNSYKNQHIPAPEIGSTLLLADSIIRLISGEKYKSGVEEALLSPRETIEMKIIKGGIQNENDISKNFYKLLTGFDDKKGKSWFSTVKNYFKSKCQPLGFFDEEDNDNYMQDIKHLFAFEDFYGSLTGI